MAGSLLLASCSGGGGGGGEDGNFLTGDIALSQDTATFSALTEQSTPAPEFLTMSVEGPITSIAYDADGGGPLPDWLELSGSFLDSETLELRVRITRTNLVESRYTSAITFYALGADERVHDQVTLQVHYDVIGQTQIQNSSWLPRLTWGHSTTTATTTMSIKALGERWQVTSDVDWLTFDGSPHLDSAELQVSVDTESFDGPGTYRATLQLANLDEPNETDTMSVHVLVDPPRFHFTSPVVIGGSDGYQEGAQPLNVSLITGTNSYTWTATTANAPWLQLERTTGPARNDGDTITVDADRSLVEPGWYVGTVRFEADVKGHATQGFASVRLNHQENRLHVVDDGLALYELPGRSRLAAQIPVRESRGRSGTPWTASADMPWLTVTPGGSTGGSLAVSADTSTLAADTVHVATITIVSDDPGVHNAEERITVGLWKSATPPADLSLELPFDRIAANPVFPYVHVLEGDVVTTYNIYTGGLASSVALEDAQWANLGATSNGRTLVLPEADTTARTFVDLQSGAITKVTNTHMGYSASPERLRIEGHSYTLEWPCCTTHGALRAVTADGRRAFSVNAVNWMTPTTHSLTGFNVDWTALFHWPLDDIHFASSSMMDTGAVGAMAVAEDRRSVLLATADPSELRLVDGVSRVRTWTTTLAGTPNNALVRADGLLIAGAEAAEGLTDVWLFDFDGTLLAEHSSPTGTLLARELELGSDRHRLVVPTDAGRVSIIELPPLGPALEP